MGKCSWKDAPPTHQVSWLAGWGPTLVASLGYTESSCGSGPRGRLRAHSEIRETFITIEAECLPAPVWDTLTAFAVGRHQEPSHFCTWKPRLMGTMGFLLSRIRLFGLQHARLPPPSPSPKACSNSCPPSRWCHPPTSSSVARVSSCPQSTVDCVMRPTLQMTRKLAFTWQLAYKARHSKVRAAGHWPYEGVTFTLL